MIPIEDIQHQTGTFECITAADDVVDFLRTKNVSLFIGMARLMKMYFFYIHKSTSTNCKA